MKNRKHQILLTLILFVFCSGASLLAQNKMLGLELQAYPTGFIPGVSLDAPIGNKSFVHIKLGANIFDHRDLGVQMEETGSGYGFTLGYRRFFNESLSKWRLGVKTDLWFNKVDWMDVDENDLPTSGETDITVLQPTAELSYVINKSNWIISPSIAFGLEWNVKTDGEPTGEGPILLVGIQVARKL